MNREERERERERETNRRLLVIGTHLIITQEYPVYTSVQDDLEAAAPE
jgi:hypothetical protein